MICSRRNFSILKSFLQRHKWTVVIALVWIVALVHVITMRSQETVIEQKRKVSLSPPVTGPKYYDVLLNSYMRGGSTLTGVILGHRRDSFYVYEPLWKIARWVYWKGNDTVCRTDNMECRSVSPEKSVDAKFMFNKEASLTGSLRLAQKILYKIYDCQFNDFDRLVVEPPLTAKLGGPSWLSTKTCIDKKKQQTACVNQHIPKACKNATHRVTKVLRVTPDNLEFLLQTRRNLKIIHLFRDPRAIMNSRIETSWYPSKDKAHLRLNTESLCNKMLYDFHAGQRLYLKYPDRFRFLYYEDLNDDPLDKVKTIYKYLGMTLDESTYSVLKKIKVFHQTAAKTEREKNTAFWWRKTLDWDVIQQIDAKCKDVYSVLGYIAFSSHYEIKNLTLKSVHIPMEYRL